MKKGLVSAVIVTITTLALFVFLEGAASVAGALRAFATFRDPFMATEKSHTEYDPLLGWINRPSLYLADLYGKGRWLRTNAQRLRATHDYTAEAPSGKTRVICSGDSFTLGHDVANDEAWCSLLESRDPRLETVNMGQAAYGVDQAYLWYRRDGAKLAHQVQILAFITSDFDRMRYDRFGDFPKPYLRVAHDSLEVMNTPVPPRVSRSTFALRLAEAGSRLRIVGALARLTRRAGARRDTLAGAKLDQRQLQDVVTHMFAELKRLNEERGSTLVLVYLPKSLDSSNRSADPWRAFVKREADRLGIPFIDLVDDYRKMPAYEGEAMFTNPFHPSHYTPQGNAWAASLIHDRLVTLPAVRAAIEARTLHSRTADAGTGGTHG
jgi:hypothetical protein